MTFSRSKVRRVFKKENREHLLTCNLKVGNFGSMVEWLQCRLVTPCGTGSNPVRAAKKSSEAVINDGVKMMKKGLK